MATTAEALDRFRRDFAALVSRSERFAVMCRSARLQAEHAVRLRDLRTAASALKRAAVQALDEAVANEMLSHEFMLDALAHEIEMYVALKIGDPGAAWEHLVDAQLAATHAVKSHHVAARLEDTYIPRLQQIEQLLFPRQLFASVGIVVTESHCSICSVVYGDCGHIKGRPYLGQLCARIVDKSTLREVSLVEEPANKRCRVLAFPDELGIRRDALSWEPIQNPKA